MINPSTIFIFFKNDTSKRELEGVELKVAFLKGFDESLPVIKEGDVLLRVDPVPKNRIFYQRENRQSLARIVRGGRGLDLFCYSGAWGLQFAKNSAEVFFVDISETALRFAKENAELNNLQDRVSFLKADVFDYLTVV